MPLFTFTKTSTIFLALPFLVLVAVLGIPSALFAAGLVPCGGPGEPPCGFDQLIKLVENLIDFAILIAAPLAAIMFAYAGWLYLSSQGSEQKVKSAHGVFMTVLWGILFILGAWIFVKFLTAAFLREGFSLLGN
ncbi:MAG: hypothetical protein HYS74_02295 [Parcubacteria group bacterium]|nr:hypothetical protein [Parcubacteria group bacterium]